MTGIVEPHAGARLLRRPGIERQRLGALHVGIEPAKPEQPGGAPGAGAHRDFSRDTVATNLDKGRFRIGYASCCGHGSMPRRKTVWLSPRDPSTEAVQAKRRLARSPECLRNRPLRSMSALPTISTGRAWPKCLAFDGFRARACEFACPLALIPSDYRLPFTTLEKSPFAVPTEPRPPPPRTGRAPMMKSATHRFS